MDHVRLIILVWIATLQFLCRSLFHRLSKLATTTFYHYAHYAGWIKLVSSIFYGSFKHFYHEAHSFTFNLHTVHSVWVIVWVHNYDNFVVVPKMLDENRDDIRSAFLVFCTTSYWMYGRDGIQYEWIQNEKLSPNWRTHLSQQSISSIVVTSRIIWIVFVEMCNFYQWSYELKQTTNDMNRSNTYLREME